MADDWVKQLQQLNDRLKVEFSDKTLGDKEFRRSILNARAGTIRPLERLSGEALNSVLAGRVLVGVDGTINTFGGQYPYYIDLIRALAKPSRGDSVVLKEIHCPIPPDPEADEEVAQRNDNEVRQRKLADLEIRAAMAAIDMYKPAVVLMDGPLVRFDMRTKDSFLLLREKIIRENILLLGCIENIESKVLETVLGDAAPAGWRNRFDRDILWGTLNYGEVLEVREPAKGLPRQESDEKAVPIRTWFMRSALEPGVIGLDMLDEQAGQMSRLADYLFTLSPADGRGIPIWIDLVDREVKLSDAERDAYFDLLDPDVRRIFRSKRNERFF